MTRTSRTTVVSAAALTVAAVLSGCTSTDPVPSPPPASSAPARVSPGAPVTPSATPSESGLVAVTPTGEPSDVVTGLDAPWSVAFVGGTPLVSERDTGLVLELLADGTTREVGVVDGIAHGGEGGLLGLVVDDASRLYAYSTGADGNRVQRFALTGAPGSFALGAVDTILEGLPSAGNHNGGRLALGPDGMLYVSVGDAGQPASAQDVDALSGKILRLTPDGDVPDDNPFAGSPVYSYGHRNVQGLGWVADGTMFASEFGQSTWDELNVIVAGGNYGWPDVEGAGGGDGFVDPVQQWATDVASPSGLAVVGGTVFLANLRGEVLRAVPVADPSTSTDYFAGEYGRLRDVTAAPDGGLWVVTNNTDGRGTPRGGDDRILRVDLTR